VDTRTGAIIPEEELTPEALETGRYVPLTSAEAESLRSATPRQRKRWLARNGKAPECAEFLDALERAGELPRDDRAKIFEGLQEVLDKARAGLKH
jgi:hypothetical protein